VVSADGSFFALQLVRPLVSQRHAAAVRADAMALAAFVCTSQITELWAFARTVVFLVRPSGRTHYLAAVLFAPVRNASPPAKISALRGVIRLPQSAAATDGGRFKQADASLWPARV
jgi:hypothetical protein